LAESLPDSELAFTHNLETLIDEILRDGAQVLLVPFRMNPRQVGMRSYASQAERNERIIKRLAAERGLALAPFPAALISPQNWVGDDCHLNAAGCRQKAAHIAPLARKLLWPSDGAQAPE
jgi:hypothetical protein